MHIENNCSLSVLLKEVIEGYSKKYFLDFSKNLNVKGNNIDVGRILFEIRVACVFLVAFLFFSLALVDSAVAQQSLSVNVESPVERAVYTSGDVKLKISGTYDYPIYISSIQITYYIDSQTGQMPLTITYDGDISRAAGEIVLTLSQGEHQLSITGEAEAGTYFTDQRFSASINPVSINFLVNLGVVPDVSVFPGLGEHQSRDVYLNITTDRADAAVSYSLDGLANVTLPKTQTINFFGRYWHNASLLGLADGPHVLKAFAKDVFGNTGVYSANFTVNPDNAQASQQPTQQSTDKPAVPTYTVVIVTTVILAFTLSSALILVFSKKHKIKRTTESTQL
jgi:hypothetical protein